MKKQWKGFTLGVVVTLLIVSMVGSAFAAYQRQATLEYADIKLVIDGEAITPTDASGNTVEPFIIDGTTYLPIRAIANALGLDVAWDNNTKTATLTSPSYGQSEEQANTVSVYITRTGEKYHYDNSCNGGTYYEVTLQEALNMGLEPCSKCVGTTVGYDDVEETDAYYIVNDNQPFFQTMS